MRYVHGESKGHSLFAAREYFKAALDSKHFEDYVFKELIISSSNDKIKEEKNPVEFVTYFSQGLLPKRKQSVIDKIDSIDGMLETSNRKAIVVLAAPYNIRRVVRSFVPSSKFRKIRNLRPTIQMDVFLDMMFENDTWTFEYMTVGPNLSIPNRLADKKMILPYDENIEIVVDKWHDSFRNAMKSTRRVWHMRIAPYTRKSTCPDMPTEDRSLYLGDFSEKKVED